MGHPAGHLGGAGGTQGGLRAPRGSQGTLRVSGGHPQALGTRVRDHPGWGRTVGRRDVVMAGGIGGGHPGRGMGTLLGIEAPWGGGWMSLKVWGCRGRFGGPRWAPSTHAVVQEEAQAGGGVAPVQEPLEELGQERGGLLHEDPHQHPRQLLVLGGRGGSGMGHPTASGGTPQTPSTQGKEGGHPITLQHPPQPLGTRRTPIEGLQVTVPRTSLTLPEPPDPPKGPPIPGPPRGAAGRGRSPRSRPRSSSRRGCSYPNNSAATGGGV